MQSHGPEISIVASAGPFADDADRGALRELYGTWLREVWPAETRPAHDNQDVDLGGKRALGVRTALIARADDGAAAGALVLQEPDPGGRTAGMWLYVDPDQRMRGVCRALLSAAFESGAADEPDGIVLETASIIPAGEAVARKVGAQMGPTHQLHEAVLSDLDLELLEWRARTFRDSDVGIEILEGPYAPADVGDVAELKAAMYATHGRALGPERARRQIREFESIMERLRLRRLAVLAREQGSGRVVGVAEAVWDPASPRLLRDWHLGLAPERHGRKVGGALLVTLLLEIPRRLPDVQVACIGSHVAARPLHERLVAIGFQARHVETGWLVSSGALAGRLRGGP